MVSYKKFRLFVDRTYRTHFQSHGISLSDIKLINDGINIGINGLQFDSNDLSYASFGNGPEKAFDENPSTTYWSDLSEDIWISVEFADIVNIDKISIRAEQNYFSLRTFAFQGWNEILEIWEDILHTSMPYFTGLYEFSLFEHGDGTEGNPYEIWSIEDLYKINGYLIIDNLYYKQMIDIDLTGIDWSPIGVYDCSTTVPNDVHCSWYFRGNYDGNYFKIINMSIDWTDKGPAKSGFFETLYADPLYNITIKNMFFINPYVYKEQGSHLGVLASFCSASSWGGETGLIHVFNCHVENGIIDGIEIWSASGLIGEIYTDACIIEQCSFIGTVNTVEPGGLITSYNGGQIINCFAIGELNMKTYSPPHDDSPPWGGGGIVGLNWGIVTNCYSIVDFSYIIESDYASPIAPPWSESLGEIYNSYYSNEQSGIPSPMSAGEIGLTVEQMKKRSNFLDWDFNTVWGIHSTLNDGFPILRNMHPDFNFLVSAYNLHFIIKDRLNNPLQEVKVFVTGENIKLTNNLGQITFEQVLPSYNKKYNIFLKGYQPIEEQIDFE